MDGTLLNTEELYPEVCRRMLAMRGKDCPEQLLENMMGYRAHVSLQVMKDWHALHETVDELRHESSQMFMVLIDERLGLMPGVHRLLDAIEAAGLPKAVGTSSSREFAEHMLSRVGLLERFEFLLCAEDVQEGKPDPEIYRTAAERFGFDPGDVLVLEDSQTGFRAAHAAGTIAVAVPGPHSCRHDFTGARMVLDTLCDDRLYALLGGAA